jgi:hypothetical protein
MGGRPVSGLVEFETREVHLRASTNFALGSPRAWSDSSGLIGPEHEGYRIRGSNTPRRQLVSTKQVKG